MIISDDSSLYYFSWMKSSLILSLPGLVFSLVFTLPHYFQLSTLLVPNMIPLPHNHTLWQVSDMPC